MAIINGKRVGILPPHLERCTDPLDPRSMLPFSRELEYEDGHRTVEGLRVANDPYRK